MDLKWLCPPSFPPSLPPSLPLSFSPSLPLSLPTCIYLLYMYDLLLQAGELWDLYHGFEMALLSSIQVTYMYMSFILS